MIRYFVLLASTFFLLLWSCFPHRYIDIQVLKPAQLSWTHSIDTLFLLEAMKINQNERSEVNKLLYLKFLYSFNQSLDKNLKESPLLANSVVKSVPYNYLYENYRNSSMEERKHLLLCAVNTINIKDTTYKHEAGEFYNQVTCQAIYHVKVTISDFINRKSELTIEDTVFWDSEPIFYAYDIDAFAHDTSEVYVELGDLAGEKVAKKIAPYWVTDERVIFHASNKYMRRGYNCFAENDALQAIQYWQKIYDSGTRRLAAMASYNIALSYETLDSLNLSKEWVEKSIKLKKELVKMRYLRLINDRIEEKNKLDKQFELKTKQKTE